MIIQSNWDNYHHCDWQLSSTKNIHQGYCHTLYLLALGFRKWWELNLFDEFYEKADTILSLSLGMSVVYIFPDMSLVPESYYRNADVSELSLKTDEASSSIAIKEWMYLFENTDEPSHYPSESGEIRLLEELSHQGRDSIGEWEIEVSDSYRECPIDSCHNWILGEDDAMDLFHEYLSESILFDIYCECHEKLSINWMCTAWDDRGDWILPVRDLHTKGEKMRLVIIFWNCNRFYNNSDIWCR